MKRILFIVVSLLAVVEAGAARRSFCGGRPAAARATSGGLYAGEGALTPMEARLERASGKDVRSTRIGNAVKARRKLKRSVPPAQPAAEGSKVRYMTVTKKCPCETKTVTATGGGKVGIGKTAAEAKAAATGNKASW